MGPLDHNAKPADVPGLAGAPLFISAPTSRCGSTLVQRLFNSSPDALVFGEGVGQALLEHAQAYAARARLLARAEEQRRDLARALAREPFWCPHLTADVPGYVELFAESLRRFVRFHEEAAREHGRRVWGVKLPTVPIEALGTLLSVLPGTRIVYVVRALEAAAASAKARRFLERTADFAHFGAVWRAALDALAGLRDDARVLVVEHERFEREPAALLAELAAFAGLRALDPAVLAARVNTWEGTSAAGHAPGQYLPPSPLSAEERAALAGTRAA